MMNQRNFPRIPGKCPVLYKPDSTSRWLVAKLVDYSATGLAIICETHFQVNDEFDIQVKPGSNRIIPGISGRARTVNCEPDGNNFRVSCQLIQVQRPDLNQKSG
jgi:hypothetical protein